MNNSTTEIEKNLGNVRDESVRTKQFYAAEEAITSILGPTGDTKEYHDILIACDGFDPGVKLSAAEDARFREAFEKLYTTFGNLAPLVKQFWQSSASVREKYLASHTSPR